MKYKLVIFDLDGTILDTLDDLADSLNYALAKNNFPTRTIDEVRRFVGNGIKKLIERGVPTDTSSEATEQVYNDFTEHYKIHCKDKTKPYNGIVEFVRTLKDNNIKTAVVSNKADYAVKILCEEFFGDIFDITVGEREGIRKKPYPDSVNEVISKLGLSDNKNAVVYIGDSDVDIETAKNANIDVISVTWGFRDKDFLKKNGAKVIVDTIEETKKYILP